MLEILRSVPYIKNSLSLILVFIRIFMKLYSRKKGLNTFQNIPCLLSLSSWFRISKNPSHVNILIVFFRCLLNSSNTFPDDWGEIWLIQYCQHSFYTTVLPKNKNGEMFTYPVVLLTQYVTDRDCVIIQIIHYFSKHTTVLTEKWNNIKPTVHLKTTPLLWRTY